MKNRKIMVSRLATAVQGLLLLACAGAAAADSALPAPADGAVEARLATALVRALDDSPLRTPRVPAAAAPAADYSDFLEKTLRERLPARPVVTIYRYRAADAATHGDAWLATRKGDEAGSGGGLNRLLLRHPDADLHLDFQNWD